MGAMATAVMALQMQMVAGGAIDREMTIPPTRAKECAITFPHAKAHHRFMASSLASPPRRTRFLNRWHAHRSTRRREEAQFLRHPDPRSVGSFARGQQICEGKLFFAGHQQTLREGALWDLPAPDPSWHDETHSFLWLDDLAAVPTPQAETLARSWTSIWLARFQRGAGPGWQPHIAARRLLRWINHATLLHDGQSERNAHRFLRALNQHTLFLAKRLKTIEGSADKLEAATALLHASLLLTEQTALLPQARAALDAACSGLLPDAQSPSPFGRNPENALNALTMLTWASELLQDHELAPSAPHANTIAALAPLLRGMRHSDGALARFHGGGRGLPGRLDMALAASRNKKPAPFQELTLGYARLCAGRSTVIVDAAAPPSGHAATHAHASTLALEFTHGRRPIVVNCGSGRLFGPDWHRAARATPSHSTLELDGYSSARLAGTSGSTPADARAEMLVNGPGHVPVEMSRGEEALLFEGGHDGYVASHGLTHARRLELEDSGEELRGEDMLLAVDSAAQWQFDQAMEAVRLQGIPYDIRFHLHPEITVQTEAGGESVILALPGGQEWVFRKNGTAHLAVEQSVYLEKGWTEPRTSRQIVLTGRAHEYATRVRWSLTCLTPSRPATRDIAPDDTTLLPQDD